MSAPVQAAPRSGAGAAAAARIEKRFPGLIAEVDDSLRALVATVDVRDLARHNAGYLSYSANPYDSLVENEKARYLRALETITAQPGLRTVADFGTFIPYLPVALARLGYEVRVVEKFSLYGDSFRAALDVVMRRYQIQVYDLDILQDPFDAIPRSDVALLMAVVEHLNGSPRELMVKVRERMAPGGMLLFEVPNIAETLKRVGVLVGRSPLPDYAAYLESAYPFMGHNREMTVEEVRYLLEQTGYRVEELETYDYAPQRPQRLRGRLALVLKRALPLRNSGQAIVATARTAP